MTFLFAGFAQASESEFLERAEAALSGSNAKMADFWIARYLGAQAENPEAVQAVEGLVSKRVLEPAGFIPADSDPEFLDWFERSTWKRWGVPADRVREKYGSVEIAAVSDGSRFFTLVAYPELQTWFTWSHSSQSPSRRLLLVMGSSEKKRKPLLFTGKFVSGQPVQFPTQTLEVKNSALHSVWPPEFYDLEGDGEPELWLRYNLAQSNGFKQVLDVYKLDETRGAVLAYHFEGRFEGVARRIAGGRVEIATGKASRKYLSHLEFDLHGLETREYSEGEFQRGAEKEIPHLLKTPAWKDRTLT